MKRKKVNFRLSIEMIESIRKLADENGVTATAIVETAVRQLIRREQRMRELESQTDGATFVRGGLPVP